VANVNSVSSTSKQVEAVLPPSAEFSVTQSDATITVKANETNAASWQWNFGDGYTASGPIATHTYTSTEVMAESAIELTIKGNNGCVSTEYQFMGTSADIYLPIIIK